MFTVFDSIISLLQQLHIEYCLELGCGATWTGVTRTLRPAAATAATVSATIELQLILTADHDVCGLFQLVGAGDGSAEATFKELVGAKLAAGHQLGELRAQPELHVQETILPRIGAR